jgi:hypothetical protein
MNIIEHLFGAVGLGKAGHVIDELACHVRASRSLKSGVARVLKEMAGKGNGGW